jgi:hypothetical protein
MAKLQQAGNANVLPLPAYRYAATRLSLRVRNSGRFMLAEPEGDASDTDARNLVPPAGLACPNLIDSLQNFALLSSFDAAGEGPDNRCRPRKPMLLTGYMPGPGPGLRRRR